MQFKKIISVAATTLLLATPFASQAIGWEKDNFKIDFKGSIRPSINNDDCFAGTATPPPFFCKEGTSMSGNFSSFMFQGSYKMENGIAAIFKTEWKFDPTETKTQTPTGNEDDSLVDFEQYLGLKGGFGTIKIGHMLTPYMQSGVMLDPFRRDAIAGRFFVDIYSALHHGNGFGRGRATDTIRYDTPKIAGGLSAQVFVSIDESEEDDHAMGAGVIYKTKKLLAFAQYYDANRPGDSTASKVGAKVHLGNAAIWGQYEIDGGLIALSEGIAGVSPAGDLSYTVDNQVDGADIATLGGSYKIGKVKLIAQYGERDDSSGGAANDGHSGSVLGVSYAQKKNLYYYAGLLNRDFNDAKDDNERFTVGTTFTW